MNLGQARLSVRLSSLPPKRRLWLVLAAAGLLLLGACAPASLDPPRMATATALASPSGPQEETPTPQFLAAPSPTPGAEAVAGPQDQSTDGPTKEITLWIDDPAAAAVTAVEEISSDFKAAAGIDVDLVVVRPDQLPQLIETAVISNTLPDLILHPLAFTIGWAERDILDPQAASTVVERLDPGTFRPGALELVSLVGDDVEQVAAIPSEGWPQLVLYRQDWFQQQGLDEPADYASLMNAAATLFQPDSVVSGIVVPTESDLAATQQVFEQLAAANGCDLVNRQGEVALLHPACLEALDFYRQLVNQYSPIGVQTEVSALNAFLAGRTGIIMASSAVLPQLAGLDPEFPPRCPNCADGQFLARNTGFLNRITGSGQFAQPAGFAEIKALGITAAADTEAAVAFAQHWFEAGYATWLGANPERKIPLRQGTVQDPELFGTAWLETPLSAAGPTLSDLYGSAEISALEDGLLPTQRWGFAAGRGELVTALYEELTLSPLLQEMLSGYFTSSQTVIEMQRAVASLIPGYDFPLPTPPGDDSEQ